MTKTPNPPAAQLWAIGRRWYSLRARAKARRIPPLPRTWADDKNGRANFVHDVYTAIGLPPDPRAELARIDTDRPYSARNVRWLDRGGAAKRASTKVSPSDWATIRARLARGDSPRTIARDYGLSPGYVYRIHQGTREG